MEPAALIDLSPNRRLLDSNFDGYKLSLEELAIRKIDLKIPVDRILLDSSQYSLLHTKLYGLHNHLIGDPQDENGCVYFIDKDWDICKIYVDLDEDLTDPLVVWEVPKNGDRKTGDYNVSLKFVNKDLAVVADGTGILYILDTGSRSEDGMFTLLFSDEVAGHDERFIIADAVHKSIGDQKEELHTLLVSIKQDSSSERFATFLYWITLVKSEGGNWEQVALKQLKTNGDVQYSYLERDGNAVYVVSDSGCRFTLNSDCPLRENKPDDEAKKSYKWSQTIEDVTIKMSLPQDTTKESIIINTEATAIEIKRSGNDLLCGQLHQRIDSDLTTWSFENNILEVVLNKNETGLMWPELVIGNNDGEHVLDTSIVEEVHERLAHLCSESEAPQSGTTFNSQPVEECDYETDKTIRFERLSGTTNKVTHKVNLGSHQVLLTVNLNPELAPALGIRHDVDVCFWQPRGGREDFSISHDGTLLAFGYVQASKQNRKFSVCPTDMSYSAICESSRHLFIYRQKKPVSLTQLRNRITGRRIHSVAQQQVISLDNILDNNEIIGIYATTKVLFLLCENSVTAVTL